MSLVYGFLGYIIGIVVFIAIPFLLPNSLHPTEKQRLSEFYYKQAARLYDRMLFHVNRHGDGILQSCSFSTEKQADMITRDKEDLYFDDESGNITRLYNYPLALASSEYGKIISPMDIAIADAKQRLAESIGLVISPMDIAIADAKQRLAESIGLEMDAEGLQTTAKARHVRIPKGLRLFDLRDSEGRLLESFEPNDPEKAEEDMKRSQEGFKSRSAMDIMIHVMIAVGTVFLAWIIWSNSSAGGDSVVALPVWLVGVLV